MGENKYPERCRVCKEWVKPYEGIFENKQIRHSVCAVLLPEKAVSEKENFLTQLYIIENKALFCKTIYKRLRNHFPRIYDKQSWSITYEEVDEIFDVSLGVFAKKYSFVEDENITRRVFYTIIKIQVFRFIEKKIDRLWYGNLSKREQGSGFRPPSYYYHKKFWKENADKINERRRANYAENKRGLRQKTLERVAKNYQKKKSLSTSRA